MRNFEDHFSRAAKDYARHRPRYPDELFAYLASVSPGLRLAWDCGAGSGQAAVELARHFARVVATDASPAQLEHALRHERVEYRVEPAEAVSLEPGVVDLVTAAAAAHWFDLGAFYAEVRRVAAPGCVLAAWTYHQSLIEPAVDRALEGLSRTLGEYWPPRFHLVAERYRTLPFPFDELAPPGFEARAEWDLAQVLGFVESWSASQRYAAAQGRSAADSIRQELADAWGAPDLKRPVRWPLCLRVGRVG